LELVAFRDTEPLDGERADMLHGGGVERSRDHELFTLGDDFRHRLTHQVNRYGRAENVKPFKCKSKWNNGNRPNTTNKLTHTHYPSYDKKIKKYVCIWVNAVHMLGLNSGPLIDQTE